MGASSGSRRSFVSTVSYATAATCAVVKISPAKSAKPPQKTA